MLKFLMLVLAIGLSSVRADWELISTTDSAHIYIDRDSIQFSETTGSVWEIQNLQGYDDDDWLSYRYLSQYDCFNRRWMYSAFTKHDGPMATGEIITRTSKASNWLIIPPNTPAATVFKIVCSVKD